MIEYISGRLTDLTPTYAVVETGGIGYLVNISLPTYSELEGKDNIKLLIHQVIREDAWLLFGFISEQERLLFRALIGVSGVGANTARMILSSIPAPDLEWVIINGDSKTLKKVKGVGVKTAERIIVDLRDKITPTDESASGSTAIQMNSEVMEEALAAMVMLGYPRQAVIKVMKKIFEEDPAVKVEIAIKKALAMI